MTPGEPKPKSLLPRIHFHPLCRLGRHKPDYYRLKAVGEKWTTFVFTCTRCNRVVGDSHAAVSEMPVTGNK